MVQYKNAVHVYLTFALVVFIFTGCLSDSRRTSDLSGNSNGKQEKQVQTSSAAQSEKTTSAGTVKPASEPMQTGAIPKAPATPDMPPENKKTLRDIQFREIGFIQFAPDGSLYVSDPYRPVLYRFSNKGILEKVWDWTFNEAKHIDIPKDIAFDRSGNMLMISARQEMVYKLAPDGNVLLSYGGKGTADGQFDLITSIAVDSRDYVYIADSNNRRIQIFSHEGKHIRTIAEKDLPDKPMEGGGIGKPNLREAIIGIGRDDTLFVLTLDKFYQLSQSGQYLSSWSVQGTGADRTWNVNDFCFDEDGNLFIVDSGSHRIKKVSPEGKTLGVWGTFGDETGCYKKPSRIAMSPEGLLCVGDDGNERVQMMDPAIPFSPKTESIADYPVVWRNSFRELDANPAIAVTPFYITGDASGRIFITESNNTIRVYTRELKLITEIGVKTLAGGNKPGMFVRPRQMAIDSKGCLYVADFGNKRIQKFDRAGKFLNIVDTVENVTGSRGQISALAVDRSDNLYAADLFTNVIMKFDAAGKLTEYWPMYYKDLPQWSSGGVEYLAADPDGNLIVCDERNSSIVKYDGTGKFLMRIRTPDGTRYPLKRPKGIAFDSHGTMYVADVLQNRIFVFAPDGTYKTSWGYFGLENGKFNSPGGIYIDKSDTLYVCDTTNFRVQTFTLK